MRAHTAILFAVLVMMFEASVMGGETPPDPNQAPATPQRPGGETAPSIPAVDPNAPAAPPAPAPADPLAEARKLLTEDRFEEALAAARKIVESDPSSAAARTLLGDALYRRGDFDEAETAYRAAAAADPNFAAAHFGVGRILRTLGRYGEAPQSFHRAAALAPDNAKYVRILANHLARREDVITMLKHYLEMPPAEDEGIIKNVRAWIALLEFLGEEPLGEIVRSDPTDLPMNVLKAQAYFKADVDGAKGQRFAFDTGATGITVSPRLAKQAKLKVIQPFTITAMGEKSTVRGDLVLIRNLTVGGVSIRNVTATVAEPVGMEEGLVGPSIFGAFRITVDLDSGTLGLRRPQEASAAAPKAAAALAPANNAAAPPPASSPSGSVKVPFRNVGGQIIVHATINGTPLNAMVDTGSSSSVASLTSVPRVEGLELLPGGWVQGKSAGLGGNVARKALRAATLGFAGIDFKADGTPCVDLGRFSKALESEIYVVVGFPELSRFVFEIDYAAMTLTLTPRPR